MTTDTRTTNRSYPLPYPSNLLAEDVVRLREALVAIDADIADRPNAAAISAQIQQAVQDLIAGAPGTLDTLNELAAALADDANFATTVASSLAQLQEALDTTQNNLAALDARVVALNTWQVVTSNITATANSRLFVNTSSAARTITLPATPTTGTYVQIVDAASTFGTNNCTVARNGSLVMGLAEDLVLDVKNASITLVYADASTGWRIS